MYRFAKSPITARWTVGAAAVAALCLGVGSAAGTPARPAVAPASITSVPATLETTPVNHASDAADDPAIWVNSSSPANSLIIGNDKLGALETYNLDGTKHQRITAGADVWGNVDVRQGVTIGHETYDVAVVAHDGLQVYGINRSTGWLTNITGGSGTISTSGEGVCLYHSPQTGLTSAFIITAAGKVRQYTLTDPDGDGRINASRVREFSVGSEAEGCVADDHNGALYIDQEDVALWRYGAEPGDGATRTRVDSVGDSGHLVPDAEGVTIVDTGSGRGYIIASAQRTADPTHSYFTVYDRVTNDYVSAFRITAGARADGCQRTDGVAAYHGYLNSTFPQGVFVCQDNDNTAPGVGNQDFKLVRLETVVSLS